MKWNVYIENINKREIEVYNIFNHYNFLKDCAEAALNYSDKSDFSTQVKRNLMYYYGYKCEWEIILSDFPPSKRFKEKKVDVCQQVMLNYDKFIDYVWDNKDRLVEMWEERQVMYL